MGYMTMGGDGRIGKDDWSRMTDELMATQEDMGAWGAKAEKPKITSALIRQIRQQRQAQAAAPVAASVARKSGSVARKPGSMLSRSRSGGASYQAMLRRKREEVRAANRAARFAPVASAAAAVTPMASQADPEAYTAPPIETKQAAPDAYTAPPIEEEQAAPEAYEEPPMQDEPTEESGVVEDDGYESSVDSNEEGAVGGFILDRPTHAIRSQLIQDRQWSHALDKQNDPFGARRPRPARRLRGGTPRPFELSGMAQERHPLVVQSDKMEAAIWEVVKTVEAEIVSFKASWGNRIIAAYQKAQGISWLTGKDPAAIAVKRLSAARELAHKAAMIFSDWQDAGNQAKLEKLDPQQAGELHTAAKRVAKAAYDASTEVVKWVTVPEQVAMGYAQATFSSLWKTLDDATRFVTKPFDIPWWLIFAGAAAVAVGPELLKTIRGAKS